MSLRPAKPSATSSAPSEKIRSRNALPAFPWALSLPYLTLREKLSFRGVLALPASPCEWLLLQLSKASRGLLHASVDAVPPNNSLETVLLRGAEIEREIGRENDEDAP